MSTVPALQRKRISMTDASIYVVMVLISIACIFPLVHTLAVSLSNAAKANSGMVTFYPLGFTLESYQRILEDEKFLKAFWISTQRVFWVAAIAFIVTVFLAYPLSKDPSKFKMRTVYVWLLIFVMMFNGGVIPFYMTMNQLGLLNQFIALILPMLINVFNVILVINFFRSLPKEMEESASIDGAGPWKLLFQIYLPLSLPVLATITLFNIVNTWNEYFLGLILVQKQDLIPLQTYIQQIVVTIDPTRIASDPNYMQAVSNSTLNAAKMFVTMIPIMIVYPFLQRYFITGIMLGSVKE